MEYTPKKHNKYNFFIFEEKFENSKRYFIHGVTLKKLTPNNIEEILLSDSNIYVV